MNNTKSQLARAAEIAANVCIAIVALIGAAVLTKNYLLHTPAPSENERQQASSNAPAPTANKPQLVSASSGSQKGPAEGAQLSIPDVNWNESGETLVLALSNKCHFCSESAPFYQQLTREVSQRKDARVIAVFPQEVGEGKKYLETLGVPIEQVKQVSFGSIGVRGTPTLIIVDKNGTVKQSWVGRLNSERESEVRNRLSL